MHQHEYQHQQQQQQQQQFKRDESIHYQRDTTVIFKRQFSPPHTVKPILTCRKKQRAPSQPQVTPVCQVEGCHRDLVDFKGYYRRHRVCELHSKTPKSIVDGIEQRFCQQCSRFHVLQEFDDGKRSCRKRLAGHNERRRKPPVSAESGLSLPGSLLSPGDFKPFIIHQQAISAQRQHLLDGSFLCSWPEPAECSKASSSPAMTAALPVERLSHLQISDSRAISPQEQMYEFLKSHATRVPSSAAPLVSPLTIFNQGLASPPAVPPCAATALGAVHGSALSLLSAGQSSSSPNFSVVSASGVHPRSSSPKTTTTTTTGTRVLGSNSDMNNANTSGYFSSTLPINTGLYKRPVGQLDSIMQIPQPTTTTSALDMLVYSRSEI